MVTLRNHIVVLVVLGLVGLAAAILVTQRHTERTIASRESIQIHASSVTDVSDPRRLVGFVHDVFVGRVVAQAGAKRLEGDLPETQFRVEVLEAIKGSLSGTVTVNQQGGVDRGRTVLFENDALLVPGRTYLFATRRHSGEGWHTLVPVHGDIAITSDQHRTDVVEKFKRAKREEIPFSR